MDPARFETYMDSLCDDMPGYLRDIEEAALNEGIPIIRANVRRMLRLILNLKSPRNVLEIGTGAGFSAIYMRQYGAPDMHITTIEKDERRFDMIKENIERAGAAECIKFTPGDAGKVLPDLTDSYDFIFMDAAKGQYINFLPDVKRVLAKGGVLFSDNVLREGDILESRYALERRNRTIHKRMREYMRAITGDKELDTQVFPIDDGMAVSVKR